MRLAGDWTRTVLRSEADLWAWACFILLQTTWNPENWLLTDSDWFHCQQIETQIDILPHSECKTCPQKRQSQILWLIAQALRLPNMGGSSQFFPAAHKVIFSHWLITGQAIAVKLLTIDLSAGTVVISHFGLIFGTRQISRVVRRAISRTETKILTPGIFTTSAESVRRSVERIQSQGHILWCCVIILFGDVVRESVYKNLYVDAVSNGQL